MTFCCAAAAVWVRQPTQCVGLEDADFGIQAARVQVRTLQMFSLHVSRSYRLFPLFAAVVFHSGATPYATRQPEGRQAMLFPPDHVGPGFSLNSNSRVIA